MVARSVAVGGAGQLASPSRLVRGRSRSWRRRPRSLVQHSSSLSVARWVSRRSSICSLGRVALAKNMLRQNESGVAEIAGTRRLRPRKRIQRRLIYPPCRTAASAVCARADRTGDACSLDIARQSARPHVNQFAASASNGLRLSTKSFGQLTSMNPIGSDEFARCSCAARDSFPTSFLL
jgi:hypothetical protein